MQWPHDTKSHVFLRRATQRLGKLITGEEDVLTNERSENAQKIIEMVRSDLADGTLVSGVRPRAGGEIFEVPRDFWNTEEIVTRFRFGLLNFADPFAPIDDPETDLDLRHQHWIFVTQESLEARQAGIASAPLPNLDQGYLSPYLRMMTAVSRQLDVRPDNQPPIKEVKAALAEFSKRPGFPRCSDTLLKYAATLIRDFESQAGSKGPHMRNRKRKT